jgi:hypothetical protein
MTDKKFQSGIGAWFGIAGLALLVGLAFVGLDLRPTYAFQYEPGRAFADGLESGEVGLHANSVSEAYDALTTGAERVALALLVVLLIGVVVLGVWSSATHRSETGTGLLRLAAGPSADNLFLAARFSRLGDGQPELSGYLRSLRLRGAVLVSPKIVSKGEAMQLQLSSLPDFPSRDVSVSGTVTRVTSMGGEPENYLVELRFDTLPEAARWSMGAYIGDLSKRRGAFSQA